MKLISLPLEFIQQEGIIKPKDDVLFQKVVAFMEQHMGCRMSLAQMLMTWITVYVDDDGNYGDVDGIFPIRTVIDAPAVRFLSRKSAQLLIGRVRGYLQDNGASGRDVFVYIKDGDDPHRCDGYREVLESQQAEPGERWVVRV